MEESLIEQLTRLHKYLEKIQEIVDDAFELSTDSCYIEVSKWTVKLSECYNIVGDMDIDVRQLLDKWKDEEDDEEDDEEEEDDTD